MNDEQQKELELHGFKSVREAARSVGLAPNTVQRRLDKGWDLGKALATPSRTKNKDLTKAQYQELAALGFKSLGEAATHYHQKMSLVRDRWIRQGWDLQTALQEPPSNTVPGTRRSPKRVEEIRRLVRQGKSKREINSILGEDLTSQALRHYRK